MKIDRFEFMVEDRFYFWQGFFSCVSVFLCFLLQVQSCSLNQREAVKSVFYLSVYSAKSVVLVNV